MIKFLLRLPPWILTATVSLTILYLTLTPDPVPETDLEIPGLDKVVHAVMFGTLTLSIAVDYARRRHFVNQVSPSRIVAIATISSLFGGTIEIIQATITPGRSGDLLDFLADIAGAVLFAAICRPIISFIQKRQHRRPRP